jgi:DNA-3-methyladenine glycosylase II
MKHSHKAARHLAARDRRLAELIERVGPILLKPQSCTPFESLGRAIVFQQLSVKAASTIHRRLLERCGGAFEPKTLVRLSDGEIRSAGISSQKLGYLRDLSSRALAGALPLDGLHEMEDERIVEHLTAVKGIGRWSADMFLIFHLCRPDVMPTGDLGIKKAAQKLFRMRKLPEPEKLVKLSEPWRPYRTAACWYLWRSLDGAAAIGD